MMENRKLEVLSNIRDEFKDKNYSLLDYSDDNGTMLHYVYDEVLDGALANSKFRNKYIDNVLKDLDFMLYDSEKTGKNEYEYMYGHLFEDIIVKITYC